MAHTILVVDDSSTIRNMVTKFLVKNGFEVVEGDNGAAGLAKAQERGFSLIIADVNMPVMNGIDMVREIRKLPEHLKTPVFMLTTESGGAMVQQGKEAGATAWLVKPFKPESLLKGIEKVLGLPPSTPPPSTPPPAAT